MVTVVLLPCDYFFLRDFEFEYKCVFDVVLMTRPFYHHSPSSLIARKKLTTGQKPNKSQTQLSQHTLTHKKTGPTA